MTPHQQLEQTFPGLAGSSWTLHSPDTDDYNCIAFAAGDDSRWWEPYPLGTVMKQQYWPPGVPHDYSVGAYAAAFATIGYARCASGELEADTEKIALFADAFGTAKHAARQLQDGRWVSKCGQAWDIIHEDLHAVSGQAYGSVVWFMARPSQ